MASNFLSQALFTVPRSSAQCPPNNLAFSAAVSRRLSSPGVLVSRTPPRSCGFSFSGRGNNCPFLVRAEENGEAEVEVEESAENVESVESEQTEVVVADKPPSQPRVKLGDIMGILNKRAIEASDKERPIPDLRTGDIVEIKLEVPENRRRLSVYKGIVISKQNAGIHTTIRIRRVIAGVGVEIVFPVYSPNIKEIKVVSHRKVRRARLYYLREKLPRLSTFK
ncbi:UNVERIFIED_CONTAM: 50S ribosomal protein L19-1, chloroplastic [Sesamum angustifolium]|uniref:50S ribosomal protein L19-1, chloroplastic n=1 Tax=Sesamum angustifolium TaxID=2727405 RepID=A0AAW2KXV2_9LAMI